MSKDVVILRKIVITFLLICILILLFLFYKYLPIFINKVDKIIEHKPNKIITQKLEIKDNITVELGDFFPDNKDFVITEYDGNIYLNFSDSEPDLRKVVVDSNNNIVSANTAYNNGALKEGYEEKLIVYSVGTYDIVLQNDNYIYYSKLIIVDTKHPDLVLKEFTINSTGSYSINSFIESCTDVSGKCIVEFTEDTNKSYNKPGTYKIKIKASDISGNSVIKETKLTITND